MVTGSNGLLGTKLLELLVGQQEHVVTGVSRRPCANSYLGRFGFEQVDLGDAEQVRAAFRRARPDVVIHTAAMTDVDGCEREPERAWRENVEATRWSAAAAADVGAHLVHLSTEYVFDGTDGPYAEDDPPNALGVYGKTKLESERIALRMSPSCAIARTTVLFGQAANVRPNFVTGSIACLRNGQTLRVVTDQVSSPTLADNLARMTWALGSTRTAGVFHTVGASVMDRFQFALLIARTFGLDTTLVEPTTTARLGQLAPRPLRAGLKIEKFQSAFPHVPVLTAEQGLLIVQRQIAGGAPGAGAE